MQNKKELINYIDTLLVGILGVVFVAFPIFFSSQFTDFFALPKQVLLAVAVVASVILLAVRMIIQGKVQLRTTPFDLPVLLFTVVLFLSAIFAVNRFDGLINFIPLLFTVILFFIIVNVGRSQKTLVFLMGSLVLGASVASLISILSYFKIYILPFAYTQAQTFTTFGAPLDQALYLALVLPLAGYVAWPFIEKQFGRRKHLVAAEGLTATDEKVVSGFGVAFAAGFVILAAGLALTVFMLFTTSRPVILPFETGFQTAFASISQDTGRVLKSFLLGSGFGTYITDFTRFKQPAYNLDPQLWSFTFFRSSSFVLELLATTGLLGVLSFLFIILRFVREKALFLPVILAFVAAFLLPFSFTIIFVMFVLLAIFVGLQGLLHPRKYSDIEFYFVALKRGFLAAVPEGHARDSHVDTNSGYARLLPFLVAIAIVLFVGGLSYLTGLYILSDMALQRSLVSFSQNDAQGSYDNGVQAINLFPYRDTNHRVFSQLNLAIANALAAAQPEGQEVSQTIQQDILNLIQQSIASGRNAVTLAPQTALNWDNLSSIYRSLINFGENAEQFAIITNQQKIQLDPANPDGYINLGGIYYQLGQWDQAQNQFQVAVSLKPDYANAYYNLGHALESNGNLEGALAQYQAVRTLVADDENSLKVINEEIAAIEQKIGSQASGETPNVPDSAGEQNPLEVNQPETQLPERDPRAEIPGLTPTPTVRPGTPTPTPEN